MRYRIIWAILALILTVPSTMLGQVIVNAPKTVCACPDTAKKPVAAKPKAASKPVVKRLSAPPVVARKSDTTIVKTVITEKVTVSAPDTMNVKVFGKVELELSDADRTAMMESQKRIFVGEGRHQRSWWSRNWGWPVGTAVAGTVIGIVGSHYHWWGGRNITQCVAIDSPGFCSRR